MMCKHIHYQCSWMYTGSGDQTPVHNFGRQSSALLEVGVEYCILYSTSNSAAKLDQAI